MKKESLAKKKRMQTGNGKKWTIMLYLAGSNNLVDEMVYALRSLRGRAITRVVNVFVEFDTGSDVWLFPPSAFALKLGEDPSLVENLDLETVGKKEDYPRLLNTQGILRRFVTRSMLDSPDTDHYMLILSGHGSGAIGDFLLGSTKGLTIPALGVTFDRVKSTLEKRGHKRGKEGIKLFDMLGLDSCTMSMAEIGREVEPHVDYMIGAEGFELNTGWPYDRLITLDLQKNTAKLAVAIVQSYSEYYFNYSIGDLSTDQSALDLKLFKSILMPIVSKLASILSDELKDRSTREAIVLAHWAAQSYKSEQYTDLWDFCGQLKERFAEGDHVYLVAQDVQNAIDRVVMLSTYSGARFQHSHGVAIYFPWADIVDSKGGRDLSAYRLLKFTQETGWADFLDLYLEATKREPRCVKGEEPKTSHLNVRPGLFGTFAEKALSAKQGKGGGPDDGKGGGPDDGKGGGPDDGKGGGPDDGKGGGPDDGKGAFSDETKGGGPDDGKSGLQLPGLMIGEMKNPPTEWCPTGVPRKTARERSQQKK